METFEKFYVSACEEGVGVEFLRRYKLHRRDRGSTVRDAASKALAESLAAR